MVLPLVALVVLVLLLRNYESNDLQWLITVAPGSSAGYVVRLQKKVRQYGLSVEKVIYKHLVRQQDYECVAPGSSDDYLVIR